MHFCQAVGFIVIWFKVFRKPIKQVISIRKRKTQDGYHPNSKIRTSIVPQVLQIINLQWTQLTGWQRLQRLNCHSFLSRFLHCWLVIMYYHNFVDYIQSAYYSFLRIKGIYQVSITITTLPSWSFAEKTFVKQSMMLEWEKCTENTTLKCYAMLLGGVYHSTSA